MRTAHLRSRHVVEPPCSPEPASRKVTRTTGVTRVPSDAKAILPTQSMGGMPKLSLCLVLALAVAGAASASALRPPTPKEILTGLAGPAASVPGLPYRSFPYSPPAGSRPTTRQCVALWNAGAPNATRRWIVGHSARKADVTLFVQGVGQIGTQKKRTAATCAYAVTVAPNQILFVTAPPKGSTDPWSGELLRYKTRATVTSLTSRFNATVDRAGAIRLT